VLIYAGNGNAVLGNAIYGNASLGINLYPVLGVNTNDAGDTDTGTNNLQNFPVLTSVSSDGSTTTVSGTLTDGKYPVPAGVHAPHQCLGARRADIWAQPA
jgi:hypothetical protein